MRKWLPLIGLILATVILLPGVVALAATYDYYIPIKVYNNSTTDRTNWPILVSLNNSQLADLGYIDSDGLDTNLLRGVTERTYMVGSPQLGIFSPSLLSYQQGSYQYRLGHSPEQTSFPVIVGVGGNVTIVDDDDLELGGNYTVLLYGFIDTSAGSDKNLIIKVGAFRVFISASGSITAEMNPGASSINVTATNIYTNTHAINITTMNSSNMTIFVDDVLKDTVACGTNMTDNSNDWVLMENESLVWLGYIKVYIR